MCGVEVCHFVAGLNQGQKSISRKGLEGTAWSLPWWPLCSRKSTKPMRLSFVYVNKMSRSEKEADIPHGVHHHTSWCKRLLEVCECGPRLVEGLLSVGLRNSLGKMDTLWHTFHHGTVKLYSLGPCLSCQADCERKGPVGWNETPLFFGHKQFLHKVENLAILSGYH